MSGFEFTIDLQGFAEVEAALRAAPGIVHRELRRFVGEATSLLQREVMERTPTASGTLRASITSREQVLGDNVLGVVGTSLNYAVPVELGTRPHFPPVVAIEDWVRQKLDVPKKDVRSVALRIARKIAARGTEGAHMFEEAFKANREQVLRMWRETVLRIRAGLGGE